MDRLIADVVAWARECAGVRSVILVGSHARGTADADSEVDLMVLHDAPSVLLGDPSWTERFGDIERRVVEEWGRVTSLRVWYSGGPEVEFGITDPGWATATDEGTLRVRRGGMRVLF